MLSDWTVTVSPSAASAVASAPVYQSRPVPHWRLRLCAPHCHGVPDFLTSQRRNTRPGRARTYPSSSGAISDRPFLNPFSLFPPHDTLESLLTRPSALFLEAILEAKLEIEICSSGPGIFALCREKVQPPACSQTVILRPSTSAPFAHQRPFIVVLSPVSAACSVRREAMMVTLGSPEAVASSILNSSPPQRLRS